MTQPSIRLAALATVLALVLAPSRADADSAAASTLKAAFLLNFAKFTDWSNLEPGAQVVLCVLDEDRVGAALTDSVRDQKILGHRIAVWRLKVDTSLPSCHVVFVPGSDAQQVMTRLGSVKALPVLTVSDAQGFAQSGGMIEVFQDNGRMRFAVNVEVVQRSGIRLSSRLLELAKIVRSDHAH